MYIKNLVSVLLPTSDGSLSLPLILSITHSKVKPFGRWIKGEREEEKNAKKEGTIKNDKNPRLCLL